VLVFRRELLAKVFELGRRAVARLMSCFGDLEIVLERLNDLDLSVQSRLEILDLRVRGLKLLVEERLALLFVDGLIVV
jgi:hypothetical protein